MSATIPRLAYDADEAAAACSLRKESVMRAIRSGHLKAKRTGANGGGKYIVLVADLQAWLESLGDA